MSLRIAVTGANGFVGRAVVRRLARDGHDVVALVRTAGAAIEGATRVVGIGDLGQLNANSATLRDALERCDAVVHLAAWVHRMGIDGDEALLEARRINVDGTRAIAEQAAERGVRRFVYMSSIKVMGEESDVAYCERDTPRPAGAYAQTKLDAEALLFAMRGRLDVTVLRPPLVYGPGVRANFLSLLRFVARGGFWPFGAMTNRRSLMFVDNLADAVATALTCEQTYGKAYLVSDAEDVSTAELMATIARKMNRRFTTLPLSGRAIRRVASLLRRDETARRIFGSMFVDMSSFQRDSGWIPPYSLDQGIERTARWFVSTQP